MGKILLDTHILLWLTMNPEKLPKRTITLIEQKQRENNVLISSISLWEIAMLASKNKISVYEPVRSLSQDIVDTDGLKVVDISVDIASESIFLKDFHKDPADRIIVATTRVTSSTLITKDQEIIEWAQHGHIKYMEG